MITKHVEPIVSTQHMPLNSSPMAAVDDALRRVFSTPQQETLLQKSRRIMGSTASDLSDEEMEVYMTEFQHLIDYWLDGFEQQMFDGQTLQQVLGQA